MPATRRGEALRTAALSFWGTAAACPFTAGFLAGGSSVVLSRIAFPQDQDEEQDSAQHGHHDAHRDLVGVADGAADDVADQHEGGTEQGCPGNGPAQVVA